MKKLTLLLFSILLFSLLISCSTKRMQPYVSDAALKEKWMNLVVTDPNLWLRNVDPWLLAGDLPLPTMTTLKTIPLKDFNHIRVAGNFRVHIVGGQAMRDRNSDRPGQCHVAPLQRWYAGSGRGFVDGAAAPAQP